MFYNLREMYQAGSRASMHKVHPFRCRRKVQPHSNSSPLSLNTCLISVLGDKENINSVHCFDLQRRMFYLVGKRVIRVSVYTCDGAVQSLNSLATDYNLLLRPAIRAKSVFTSIATLAPSSIPPSMKPLHKKAQSALAKCTFPCFSLSRSK